MKDLSEETLGTWLRDTDLPISVHGHQCVVAKNRLYMIGGSDGLNTLNTVYCAPILEDGSLGTWMRDTDLPINNYNHQCVVIKDRLYMIGGLKGSGGLNTVYYAPILEDGSLGTWVKDTDLPIDSYVHQCIVIKDRLYMIGGFSVCGALNTVYHTPILEDGSLGIWVEDTNLPTPNFSHQCVVIKDRLYMIGGVRGTTLDKVYYAPILEDGSLGTWVKDTDLPVNILHHQCVVVGDRLYSIGGHNVITGLNVVYCAPIL